AGKLSHEPLFGFGRLWEKAQGGKIRSGPRPGLAALDRLDLGQGETFQLQWVPLERVGQCEVQKWPSFVGRPPQARPCGKWLRPLRQFRSDGIEVQSLVKYIAFSLPHKKAPRQRIRFPGHDSGSLTRKGGQERASLGLHDQRLKRRFGLRRAK